MVANPFLGRASGLFNSALSKAFAYKAEPNFFGISCSKLTKSYFTLVSVLVLVSIPVLVLVPVLVL
ncbi:MAG: hypothetical protein C0614_10385, partial [Desulfuromonas sp.]